MNIVGYLLFFCGGAVMLDRLFHAPLWNGISLSGTEMVFTSALCFLLAGIGLIAPQIFSQQMRTVRVLRITAGCTMAMISLLMLAETIFAIDLGVDIAQIHHWFQDNNPHPGRMAPNTALGFLLAGSVFLLGFSNHRIGAFIHALPAAIISIGLIGVLAHTHTFDLAYSWYGIPHMALTSAIAMVVLGIGLVLDYRCTLTLIGQDTESPIASATSDIRVYAFFGVAITILSTAFFISHGSIKALIERSAWVEHSTEVRAEFERAIALGSQVHSARVIFFTTGSRDSYNEMQAKGSEMLGQLAYLEDITRDHPTQQKRLVSIRQLAESSLKTMAMISLPESRVLENTAESLKQQAILNDNQQQVSFLAEEFRADENRLLKQLQEKSRRGAGSTVNTILFGSLLGFASLFYAARLLKQQNDQRDQLTNTLQRTNKFLDSLLENIPLMVFVKDATHLRFAHFNEAGESLLGFTKSDLIGKNDYDFFPPEEADFFTQKDRAVLAGNQVVDIPEEPLHTRNNGVRILHTKKIPIVDAQGTPLYLLGISEDITERKQAEQQIAALNADLSIRATELEASNKELESFTYSVSHDLNAPLRAISGYATMLEDDCRDQIGEAGRRHIEQIRTYSKHMGALIKDLLDLSRFGRQTLNKIDLDMSELMQQALQAELDAQPGPLPKIDIADLPRAIADPLLLRQVWANLISNALKYTSKTADAVIEIRGETIGEEVVYCVKDNGAGFDMHYYHKLFGVFQRLHRTDDFPGTGVGLAIVYRAILRHGGRVWAEGAPGQGAVFHFSLPK